MPNRVIRQDILTSDSVNQLSWPAEVFYRRLMSVVDDYGRGDGRISIIRSSCYPLQLDKVSEADITKWMGECTKVGLVSFYHVNNKPYLEIKKFGQSLRIMRSKIPDDPDDANSRSHLHANDLSKGNETERNLNMKAQTLKDINIQELPESHQVKMTDSFLKDLPSSSHLETMSMRLKVDKKALEMYIPAFQKAMRITYKNFDEFCDHFKNWYLKQDKGKNNPGKGPKKLGE